MSWIAKILGIKPEKVVDSVGNILDGLITNKEELAAAKLAIDKELHRHHEVLLENANRELEAILNDKASAREMFKANSSLQKVYAITFLVAYVALSTTLIIAALDKAEIADYAIALISSIFGAMTTKVGTITDFLFGSSLGSHSKERQLENKQPTK
ncbi:MAG: hypothetical protein O9340_04450 [Cyclobacteriaceae bacterium]|nr:hypothetical protein [Cyclobacteriaceae bacterium]